MESLKEAISADKVEGLGEVNEWNVQGHPLLSALLDEESRLWQDNTLLTGGCPA